MWCKMYCKCLLMPILAKKEKAQWQEEAQQYKGVKKERLA